MRAKIGDVLEIPTRLGLAYAQYTHRHPQFGGLVRIFDMIFSSRPTNFVPVASLPVKFSTFIPIGPVVSRGIFHVVANCDVAEENRAFPTFKSGTLNPATNQIDSWWLWDGEKSWRVAGELTENQKQLPVREILNDTMLIHRIEVGWTAREGF